MAKPGPKPGSKRKSTLFVVKRPVGRPPKSASKTDTQAAPKTDIQAAPKRRGRPPKSASKPVPDADSENPSAPKRRGRIARAKAEVGQQHHNQEPEQAESSQVQPVEAVVLEVVGTSIQPAFVIQQHGVHSPNPASAQESLADKPQGILSKAPSKKEVAAAKKLAVKKTQAMKKTATKKAADVVAATSDAVETLEQTTSTWGSAVWNTVTAPVSYLSSGIRRLSGHVER